MLIRLDYKFSYKIFTLFLCSIYIHVFLQVTPVFVDPICPVVANETWLWSVRAFRKELLSEWWVYILKEVLIYNKLR